MRQKNISVTKATHTIKFNDFFANSKLVLLLQGCLKRASPVAVSLQDHRAP